jgi:hypothetical protein
MEIEIIPILIEGEPCYKLRIDGVLYGIFWTKAEARQYAKDLRFNWQDDLSTPRTTL